MVKIGLFLTTSVAVFAFSFIGLSLITPKLHQQSFDEVDLTFKTCLPKLNELGLAPFTAGIDPSMLKQSLGIVMIASSTLLLTPLRSFATFFLLIISLTTTGILMSLNKSTAIPVGLIMLCIGMLSFLMDNSGGEYAAGANNEELFKRLNEETLKMQQDLKNSSSKESSLNETKEEPTSPVAPTPEKADDDTKSSQSKNSSKKKGKIKGGK